MDDSLFDQCIWLDKHENAFGVTCLDCRKFTHSMLSSTSDPHIAQMFSELRLATGEQYRWTHPPNAVSVTCTLNYPMTELPKNGPLYKATSMEEKWDVYLYEGVLYFSRSWTGDLVFAASEKFKDNTLTLYTIEANTEVASKNAQFIMRQVDFLMKSHVFHKQVPHPLPPDLPKDPRTIALYSFSQYGRWACFATYEETITVAKQE